MGRDDSITPAGLKPAISREDVEKLDVRIGAIKRVAAVPKSEKLPKLTVNFGNHSRQILVGMKGERTDLEGELLGRQALFIINLPPRKMAGEVSEGMVFDIGYADGLQPVLPVPEKRIANGARAG
jgi:methionine--tRNA ligase beta chain